jgi:hypothetical protein
MVLRLHGWRTGQLGPGQQAMDVLAMGAPLLVPRLAFNLMSENMLFISLREMMKDFTILTVLAVWCFAGFLLSMIWLSNGSQEPITISKWMLWIWFGLDGTGIQRSSELHWFLGPVLMVAFAFLGNTLFLTILVSMLSTTFSTIVANATAEIQFRRAVLTLEGVKSDALFAYQPPFNILALLILLPLKMIISPRWFHKINVAAVRTLNAPLLLIIGLIERRTLWAGARRQKDEELPRAKQNSRANLWDFSRGFSVHGDLSAVFAAEPPEEIQDELRNEDDFNPPTLEHIVRREMSYNASGANEAGEAMQEEPPALTRKMSRRDSVFPFAAPPASDSDSSDDGDADEFKARLEALEHSNKRIEQMLVRLCANLEPIGSEGDADARSTAGAGTTGTLKDLDKSAAEDFDD